jgi:glycosyltransferase involved in cell wall biosynthesis
MRKCDVFIALSSNYDYALQKAKKQGAIVLIECGTKHILEKKRILESISALKTKKTIPDIYEKIELASYKLANYVMIPSEHVKESFKLHNYPAEKLFVNPYCASLSHFYPTDNPANSSYDVIMVGQWCYRKGCDLLTKACLNILGVKLLHVGSVVDCPLPNHPLFTHIEPVDESQLINYYAQAKIFALPSLEEGLALVQPQALVCGLPIVCSKDTGGRDLQNFLDDKKWIIEMPETNVECLAECIKKALLLADTQSKGKRNYAGKAIDQLTWDAYGKRYSEFLKQITTS